MRVLIKANPDPELQRDVVSTARLALAWPHAAPALRRRAEENA